MGDSKEQNRSFHIAMMKTKKKIMALKERKSITQDLRTWDMIPLINKVWVSIFDQVDKNKNAIANREWNLLNRALLSDPNIRATVIDKKRETEEASEDITLSDAVVRGVIDLSTDSPTCDPKYLVSEAPQPDPNFNSSLR